MGTCNVVLNEEINFDTKQCFGNATKKIKKKLNGYNQFQDNLWIHKTFENAYDELQVIFDTFKVKKKLLNPSFYANINCHAKCVKNLTDMLAQNHEINILTSKYLKNNHDLNVKNKIFVNNIIAHQIFCQKYASGVYNKFMLNFDESLECHDRLYSITIDFSNRDDEQIKNDYKQICLLVDDIISKIQ